MRFHLDPSAPSTPGDQLADQVRFAVAAGRLAPGDRVPSVRALAREVRVNPNTVERAWRTLREEGVLEGRSGAGVFVTDAAPALCHAGRERVLAERIGRAVGDALAAGLGAEEIAGLVRAAIEAWPEGVGPEPESGGAAGERTDLRRESEKRGRIE